jgi:hypothetical protein
MAVTTCDCPNPNCDAPPHHGNVRCTTPQPPMWGGGTRFVESNPETWANPGAWVEIAEGLECPACAAANPAQGTESQSGAVTPNQEPASGKS